MNVGYDSANYYVVEQNGRRLLIDVGWPGTLAKLLNNLKRKDLVLADLDYFCVTHYHPDHAGLVQELKNKGLKHILLNEQFSAIPLLKSYMKPENNYVEIRLQDSIQFPTSESRRWLKKVGFAGEILPTPGHSDDSVSIVLDEGIAFTGDLLFPAMTDERNRKVTEQSWDKLRKLKVQTIYPGHGPARPLVSVNALIQE